MIGGLLTIFVACWVYQGAVSVKRGNVMRWVIIGAILFYAVQLAVMRLEIYFFVGDNEVDLTNELWGRIQATYRELMPGVVGLLSAAVYRTMFVMKQSLTAANLFSGMNIFKGQGKKISSEDTGSES